MRNELYIGNTVFHKKETAEVGSRKTKCLPKDEWKVCEGTHEPIISKELFELVNSKDFGKQGAPKLIEKEDGALPNEMVYCEGEKRKRGSKDSPIKGLVKCGGCRHNMQRRSRLNVSYYCRYYYEVKREDCCPENIKEAELLDVVLSVIRHQTMLAGEADKLQELYRGQLRDRIKTNQEKKSSFKKRYRNLRIRISHCMKVIQKAKSMLINSCNRKKATIN